MLAVEFSMPYESLTDEKAEELFLSLKTRILIPEKDGLVHSTGVLRNGKGEVVGVANEIERPPYETTDGLGEQEVYGWFFRMSCVCGNSFSSQEFNKPVAAVVDTVIIEKPCPKTTQPNVIPCQPKVVACTTQPKVVACNNQQPKVVNGTYSTQPAVINGTVAQQPKVVNGNAQPSAVISSPNPQPTNNGWEMVHD
jgi:hypothetical protein